MQPRLASHGRLSEPAAAGDSVGLKSLCIELHSMGALVCDKDMNSVATEAIEHTNTQSTLIKGAGC